MENEFVGLLVLGLLAANALALLLNRDWRLALAAIAVQYFLAFLLITTSWPLELAAVKLVAGWMAAAILGLTLLNLQEEPQAANARIPRSQTFLALVAGVVLVVVTGLAPALVDWSRQFTLNQAWAGLFLMGIGLMQVGLGGGPFRNILGLLTLLSGFEIIYAAVETSILVAGLLAILNLGVALIGAYLMQAPVAEQSS